MRGLMRAVVVIGVAAGLILTLLRRTGFLTGGECSPGCACSVGDQQCRCGHKTCLSPAPGA